MFSKKILSNALLALCASLALGGCSHSAHENARGSIVYENASVRGPAVLPAQLKPNFIKAADLTSLGAMDKAGLKLYGFDGSNKDALLLFKEQGFNYIKLAQMVYPFDVLGQSYGAGLSDLQANLAVAKNIADTNLSLMLELSFSDFVTNSQLQTTPASWSKLSFDDLKKAVNAYTKTTLTRYIKEGAAPRIVEIGSGLNHGFLWPLGKIDDLYNPQDYAKAAELLNAVLDGINAAYGSAAVDKPMIMLSLDLNTKSDIAAIESWLSTVRARDIEYDLIAINTNVYSKDNIALLKETIDKIGSDFDNDIIVIEKNHIFDQDASLSLGTNAVGKNASSNGSKTALNCSLLDDENSVAYLRYLLETISNTERGQGFVYWEPLYNIKPQVLSLSNSGASLLKNMNLTQEQKETTTFSTCSVSQVFDDKGRILKSIKVFNDFM